jgi:phosphoglycerate-specific signal transduction histidine kinase
MIHFTGKTKVEIIELALETYRHPLRMQLLNESYQHLREDEREWQEELIERDEIEGTLNDGLDE